MKNALVLGTVLLLAPLLSGCSVSFGNSAQGPARAQVVATEASGPQQTVPLKVVQGPGGSVLALIPVTIDGKGPFAFALDTGASNSTVDKQLAQKLGLPKDGSAGEITGVAAMTKAEFLLVKQWKIGSVQLPPRKVIGVDLGGQNQTSGLQGLIGSDILSGYGSIDVNYEKQTLTLRAKTQSVPASAAASRA